VKVRFLRNVYAGNGVDASPGLVMDLDEATAVEFVRNGDAVVIDHPEVRQNSDRVVDREPVRESKNPNRTTWRK